MIFSKKNFLNTTSIGLLCAFVLSTSGCGHVSQSLTDSSSTNQQTAAGQDLKTLNTSIAAVSDEASAAKAINDLENYANKKTNSGIHISSTGATFKAFSISDDIKQKLIKAEASLHKAKFSASGIKISSIDDATSEMSVEDYIKMKERESQSGLSSQDVADALNNAVSQQASTPSTSSIKTTAIKIANAVKPFTSDDVDLIRDKAMQLLPSSGDAGSDRISPIQALVIGYMAASNDDGTKQDGEVSFLAGQDQVDGFVSNITKKLGQ